MTIMVEDRKTAFGINERFTKNDFKDQPLGTIRVNSIFSSIQGEGPLAGIPAYFVRFSGCHRLCTFCDAPWLGGDILTYEQILEKMRTSVKEGFSSPSLVIVTGGEPTLQPNFYSFCNFLIDCGYKVQVETSGDLPIDIRLNEKVIIVCSPKVNEKTGKYVKLPQHSNWRVNYFKFVVSADPNSPNYVLPEYIFDKDFLRDREVFISPCNEYLRVPTQYDANGNIDKRSQINEVVSFWEEGLLDRVANQKNHEYAGQLCLRHGFRLNLQQHIYVSQA